MSRVWKSIRYSAIGVFFAGIITTITSCTDSEQIAAILLILALFLAGGGEESTEGTGGATASPVTIDGYTVVSSTTSCDGAGTDDDTTPADAVFNSRRVNGSNINQPGTVTLSIGSGLLTIEETAGSSTCFELGEITYPQSGSSGTALDLSGLSNITYTVSVDAGSISGCDFLMSDGANNSSTPISMADGTHSVAIDTSGGINLGAVTSVEFDLNSCVANANTELALTPFVITP